MALQIVKAWDDVELSPYLNIYMLDGAAQSLPQIGIQTMTPPNAYPLIRTLDRQARIIPLAIEITYEGLAQYPGISFVEQLEQLLAPFDFEDESIHKLSITDPNGQRERYVSGTLKSLEPLRGSTGPLHQVYLAAFQLHGDVRWRSEEEFVEEWEITASGQTTAITNAGWDDAYPRFEITPTDTITGGSPYRRFVPVFWQADAAFTDYPYRIGPIDTQIASTNFALASGDDLRINRAGTEIDRWFVDINTASTYIWVNLDFDACEAATLVSAMGAGDTIEFVDVNEDISGWPTAGIFQIDDEIFTYTGTNVTLKRFTGVVREAKGSTAAAHLINEDVLWIQNDLWIVYGDPDADPPVIDDNYAPAFELDLSTNDSWVYEEFGEADGLRTGGWTSQVVWGGVVFYGGDHNTIADPWEELGIDSGGAKGRRYLYNPSGIINANFSAGEVFATYSLSIWEESEIQSSANFLSWATEYVIPTPSTPNTWEAWSRNEALDSGSLYVGVYLYALYYEGQGSGYLECADVTVTLDSTGTPTHDIVAEIGNYPLDATLENVTTGHQLQVTYDMILDETLTIDVETETVTDESNDSRHQEAVLELAGPRRWWMALPPGSNTIKFTQVGTAGVDIGIYWRTRNRF